MIFYMLKFTNRVKAYIHKLKKSIFCIMWHHENWKITILCYYYASSLNKSSIYFILLCYNLENYFADSGIELRTTEDKPIGNGHAMEMEPVQDIRQVGHKTTQRPASMYEARDRDWQTVKNQVRKYNKRFYLYQA